MRAMSSKRSAEASFALHSRSCIKLRRIRSSYHSRAWSELTTLAALERVNHSETNTLLLRSSARDPCIWL
jgi:hypothetical protein